jgi:hypothetical protein
MALRGPIWVRNHTNQRGDVGTLFSSRSGSVLISVGDEQTGAVLSEEFAGLGWSVVGPFTSNFQALQWLSHVPPDASGDGAVRSQVDLAVVDALMTDGASLRLSMALRRRGVKVASFAAFDTSRRRLRAELPDCPGLCRDASVSDLLQAFH